MIVAGDPIADAIACNCLPLFGIALQLLRFVRMPPFPCICSEMFGIDQLLATARMQIAAREIVLWTTPSEPPKALQASECSELLDPMRASCLILAQHQPGKFKQW